MDGLSIRYVEARPKLGVGGMKPRFRPTNLQLIAYRQAQQNCSKVGVQLLERVMKVENASLGDHNLLRGGRSRLDESHDGRSGGASFSWARRSG